MAPTILQTYAANQLLEPIKLNQNKSEFLQKKSLAGVYIHAYSNKLFVFEGYRCIREYVAKNVMIATVQENSETWNVDEYNRLFIFHGRWKIP